MNGLGVLAVERHAVGGRLPEIRRHSHLRDRHDVRSENVVVDFPARQHFRELVTDQLANAQLPLRQPPSPDVIFSWTSFPTLPGSNRYEARSLKQKSFGPKGAGGARRPAASRAPAEAAPLATRAEQQP